MDTSKRKDLERHGEARTIEGDLKKMGKSWKEVHRKDICGQESMDGSGISLRCHRARRGKVSRYNMLYVRE